MGYELSKKRLIETVLLTHSFATPQLNFSTELIFLVPIISGTPDQSGTTSSDNYSDTQDSGLDDSMYPFQPNLPPVKISELVHVLKLGYC